MVEMVYAIVRAEYELVILTHSVSVFIDVDLEGRVVWMGGELVVVGEGEDSISEFHIVAVDRVRPLRTFVQRSIDSGVSVEVGSCPTDVPVDVCIRVEYVRPAERCRIFEIVYR